MSNRKFTTHRRISRKHKSRSVTDESLSGASVNIPSQVDMSPENILQLQQLVGNQAVQRMMRQSSQKNTTIQRTPQKGVIQRAEEDESGPSPEASKSFSSLLSFWKNIEDSGGESSDTDGPTNKSDTDGPTDESGTDDPVYGGYTPAPVYGDYTQAPVYDDYDDNYFNDDYDDDYFDDNYDDDFNIDTSNLDNKDKAKYKHLKPLLQHYKGEEIKSQLAIDIVNSFAQAVANGRFPSLAEAMKEQFNWGDEEIEAYLDGDNLKDDADMKVTYVDENDRKNFLLTGGGTLEQGVPDAEPFDTGEMFSKHSGAGFGIYVMSPNGELYANPHKVGLFHHSSFLAGLPTAGAGEIKVTDGALKHITNKSGHYQPGHEQMVQTLMELKGRGVGLSDVDISLVGTGPYHKDAAGYLADKQHLVDSDPVDEEDSLSLDDDYDYYYGKYGDYEGSVEHDFYGDSEYVFIKDEHGYDIRVLRSSIDDGLDLDSDLVYSYDGVTYGERYDYKSEPYIYVRDSDGYVTKVKVSNYL